MGNSSALALRICRHVERKLGMATPKTRQIIHISETTECLGSGSYGRVYKVDDTHVVKIPASHYLCAYDAKAARIELLIREIIGSTDPDALPVDELVLVVMVNGLVVEGMIKKFIPNRLDDDEFYDIRRNLLKRNPLLAWDIRLPNVRKDDDDRVWIVDTSADVYRVTSYL